MAKQCGDAEKNLETLTQILYRWIQGSILLFSNHRHLSIPILYTRRPGYKYLSTFLNTMKSSSVTFLALSLCVTSVFAAPVIEKGAAEASGHNKYPLITAKMEIEPIELSSDSPHQSESSKRKRISFIDEEVSLQSDGGNFESRTKLNSLLSPA